MEAWGAVEQEKALERILTSSDDLLELVMTLLEAAAIEANDVRLKREEVGLSLLLAQLKASLRVPGDRNWRSFGTILRTCPL